MTLNHIHRKKSRSRRSHGDEQLPASQPTLQPQIKGPNLHQPDNVIALQRTLGNQAAIKLLRKSQPAVQRDWLKGKVDEEQPRSTTITLGNNVGPAPNAPKFRSNKSDKLNDQDKQFGMYKGYKGGKKIVGATRRIIENSDQTLPIIQSP